MQVGLRRNCSPPAGNSVHFAENASFRQRGRLASTFVETAILLWLFCAAIGAAIAKSKNRNWTEGLLLGGLLGVLGVIIELFLRGQAPSTPAAGWYADPGGLGARDIGMAGNGVTCRRAPARATPLKQSAGRPRCGRHKPRSARTARKPSSPMRSYAGTAGITFPPATSDALSASMSRRCWQAKSRSRASNAVII